MMTSLRAWKPLLGLLTLATLVSGCGRGKDGPPIAKVSGTVTLDGVPLPEAAVTFQPVGSGRPSFGYTDEQGRYLLEIDQETQGAMVGRHIVSISTWREGYDNGKWNPSVPEKVPAKYNDQAADSPEMAKEVAPNNNTIDFSLDSKAGEITQRPEPGNPNLR